SCQCPKELHSSTDFQLADVKMSLDLTSPHGIIIKGGSGGLRSKMIPETRVAKNPKIAATTRDSKVLILRIRYQAPGIPSVRLLILLGYLIATDGLSSDAT